MAYEILQNSIMVYLMCYKSIPKRRRNAWNNDLSYRKNYVKSEKIVIEYQRGHCCPRKYISKIKCNNDKFFK